TSSIFWGKWWGSFRAAILVAVLPTALACWAAGRSWLEWSDDPLYMRLHDSSQTGLFIALLVALMLAYGAFVTSLGLALATRVRRFEVAVGLSVAIYLLLAAGSLPILGNSWLASVSPWQGVGELTNALSVGHCKPAPKIIFVA